MIKRTLFGIFISTMLPAIICFLLFQVYKTNRERDAVQLLQTHKDFRADQVTKNIYLGDYESSLQYAHLEMRNITHIVAILNSVVLPPSAAPSQNYTYLVIKAEDKDSQNIIDTFPYVHDFIKNATEHNGTVLVHCAKGASRSATLVIAYLMKELQISFKEAYQMVRKARSTILPNKGFVAQLQKYNKFEQISEKMVEREEEVEEKQEQEDKEKRAKEEVKEDRKEENKDYENYEVNNQIPTIYTCAHGDCAYLHGNVFTDALADVSMSVRYVIQQFINLINANKFKLI
eukprot:Phypoly_transcript_13456.p1 GENE.Phypoly_transcript_13456~~Phypoly_transcript_13456.p1  ORF type:complete len:289 (-),score=59.11 Phypoly_transcript_13456:16-882(-)